MNRSQARPSSAYHGNDMQGYMSHHQLKKQIEHNQKTIDASNRIRKGKKCKKSNNDIEEDWERYASQLFCEQFVGYSDSFVGSTRLSATNLDILEDLVDHRTRECQTA
jgi:putative cell wall-binding protein